MDHDFKPGQRVLLVSEGRPVEKVTIYKLDPQFPGRVMIVKDLTLSNVANNLLHLVDINDLRAEGKCTLRAFGIKIIAFFLRK